ncbi:MAG: hypothetical protein QMB94_09595, partial [Phycisphaerales bacterium]
MPNIVPEPGPSTRRRSGSSARRRAVADIASATLTQGMIRPDDPARDGVRLGMVAFVTMASGIGILALGEVAVRAGIDLIIRHTAHVEELSAFQRPNERALHPGSHGVLRSCGRCLLLCGSVLHDC